MKRNIQLVLLVCLSMASVNLYADEAPPIPPGYSSETAAKAAIVMGQIKMVDVKMPVPDTIEEIKDIEYAKIGDHSLQVDLYIPKERVKPTPAIVFIHGGSWKSGKRGDMRYYCIKFAEMGYVTATASYRLTQEAPFPAAVQDIKRAMNWLHANAGKYGIDPDKIAVSGNSAGGHLSMMAGYADDAAFSLNQQDSGSHAKVCAVVNFYGPTDLTTDFAKKQGVLAQFMGGKTYDEAKENYLLGSPIQHLDKDDPPTLIFHGTIDSTVPINQADMLADKLNELGIDYVYEKYEGWPHTMDLAQPVNDRAVYVMAKFFEKHLR